MIKAFAALLALALLAGCASLSENQCQSGDWYGIGIRDGSNGRLPTYFQKHVKACSKYGITPLPDPWSKGRIEGLKLYCTPQKAYEIGRRGVRPAPVCTATEAAAMARPNAFGRKYYEIGQEIRRLQNEIDDLNVSIAAASEKDPKLAQQLVSERILLRFRINMLRSRQLRYSTWP